VKGNLERARQARPQLHGLRPGGPLGPGHQHVRPRTLGTSLSCAAWGAEHLSLNQVRVSDYGEEVDRH
jgi:hypothetical protein